MERAAVPLIEPLGPHHDRASFSCGVEALDRYLKTQASQDVRKHAAASFVLVESGSPKALGYYTLSASSLELSEIPEEAARKLPRYPVIPAILLGRLAMDRSQRGKGYGELLLMDALRRSLDVGEIGWVAVIVDAKDPAAAAFYERYRFIRTAKKRGRLFLMRQTIAALLG